MNVGDQRKVSPFLDFIDGLRCSFIGDREADKLAPCLLELFDLGKRRLLIAGVGIAHGLDRNRRVAADLDRAEGYLSGFFPGDRIVHVRLSSP